MAFGKARLLAVVLVLASTPFISEASEVSLLPTIDSIHESYRDYEVNGIQSADGSICVSITTKDGELVFESHTPVVKRDGRYFEWRYLPEPGYSLSRRMRRSELHTLQGSVTAAKDIVRSIYRGFGRAGTRTRSTIITKSGRKLIVAPLDNFGCDAPFSDMTCTSNGNCCDVHDLCYASFNCDIWSWLGIETQLCSACNAGVVACITLGFENTGQPSECCAAGNCGQERPADYYFPNPAGGEPPEEEYSSDEDDITPTDGSSGGGSWSWTQTPWGWVGVGNGTCKFPNGVVVPCG